MREEQTTEPNSFSAGGSFLKDEYPPYKVGRNVTGPGSDTRKMVEALNVEHSWEDHLQHFSDWLLKCTSEILTNLVGGFVAMMLIVWVIWILDGQP